MAFWIVNVYDRFGKDEFIMEERLSYYFGGELRKLREKAGFSLKQLSKISSVDKATLAESKINYGVLLILF